MGMSSQYWLPVLSCLVYSASSMMMTLSNKIVLTRYNHPATVILWQNAVTLLFVVLARASGFAHFDSLKWATVKRWIPLNTLFFLMLFSGQQSLRLLSVPMVTILKNFQTIAVTLGDMALFGNTVTSGIAGALSLMAVGSLVAGYNDLEFNLPGYLWMLFNCAVAASYVLYMRSVLTHTNLGEFGMVYYNNMISLPWMLTAVWAHGDLEPNAFESVELTPDFVCLLLLNGMSGFFISVSSFWAIRATSPTTYSVVGALNKIPLTLLGIALFHTPISTLGGASIAVGLSGGVLYAWTKHLAAIAKIKAMERREKTLGSKDNDIV